MLQSSWKGNQRNAVLVVIEGTGLQEKIKTSLITSVPGGEDLSKNKTRKKNVL